jgi:hypothetical protein
MGGLSSYEFSKLVPYKDRYESQVKDMKGEAQRGFRTGKMDYDEYRLVYFPTSNMLGDEIGKKPGSNVELIVDDSKKDVLGLLSYKRIDKLSGESPGSLFLEKIYIRPGERKKGHGKEAMRELFKEHKETPYVKLRSITRDSGKDPVGFWEGMGAELDDGIPDDDSYPLYRLDREDVGRFSRFWERKNKGWYPRDSSLPDDFDNVVLNTTFRVLRDQYGHFDPDDEQGKSVITGMVCQELDKNWKPEWGKRPDGRYIKADVEEALEVLE